MPRAPETDPLRFHTAHQHLAPAFGGDWFGRRAEKFARFFGTATFLLSQTTLVALWIVLHAVGVFHFDLYPFILLNLAFSLQAAYAAPLILLAQTRQADRDRAYNDADARHREELATASRDEQARAAAQGAQLLEILVQNTKLTELTQELSTRIATLTDAIHRKVVSE